MLISSGKVKCNHCNLVLTRNKLYPHTKNVHRVDTKEAHSLLCTVDIRGMYCLGSEPKIRKLEQRTLFAATGNSGGFSGKITRQKRAIHYYYYYYYYYY